MLRINQAFKDKAKVAYLTAGDGGINKSAEYFLALADSSVNLLEVGIPYSDPVADGPVIQAAMERSLLSGTTVDSSLEVVKKIREKNKDVAIIIFTYYNPIHHHLYDFLNKAKESGADGILVVDLPYEESGNYHHYCKSLGLSPITVIAPSTSAERMKDILANLNTGFVYYACQKGTTGARTGLPDDLPVQIANIRKVTNLPIAVGFGVANSTMVKEILNIADGCVVGSYLVKKLEDEITPEELKVSAQELFTI
ncbi:MAG: tryptophan synthase subunit alpha [Burkholderiales bacterium]|nr:tryptophan synthase subunit alpha [Burkholderiales bacterium]